MIIFKKDGKCVNFNSNNDGRWVLSDTLDLEMAEENIYEFVNEIAHDLKCEVDDIQIINFSKYKLKN